MLAWLFTWVLPLRRVNRQALLAAPNNGHSLFQQPPWAVRGELWWGPPLKDSCPYVCGFPCDTGCNISFDFDDPTGHCKCMDNDVCAWLAGARQRFAEAHAWVHSRFRSTSRSPCQWHDSSFPALLGDPTSLGDETTPAPFLGPVVHHVTPPRESFRSCGTPANLWLDVHVTTLAGHSLYVRLSRDATPRALKTELHRRWKIPPVNQRILWRTSVLHDDEAMCDQGVSTGSTLHLVTRYLGGGPQGEGEVVWLRRQAVFK